MSILGLVLLPLIAALFSMLPLRGRAAPLLVVVAATTCALAIGDALLPSTPLLFGGYVRVDATSRLFLALINLIFFGISAHVLTRVSHVAVLREQMPRFVPLSLAFLAASNAVMIANHFLVLWISLELTSLAIAPLITWGANKDSRLASWHYLLFSTVGLGLVLLGFGCVARGLEGAGVEPDFFVHALEAASAATANRWGQLGLALIILGLGTKLGLAPMYSWLPEAYDEAPAAVTALLGAVQFNVALVVLIRVVHVFRPHHSDLIEVELLAMGLVSVVVTTFNIIAARNIKRLVAYASINHAGVIALALAIGQQAAYGLLLYVISNAFIKALLFLTVGKIQAHYGTKDTREIAGLLKDLPYSGVFLMVGTFALLGFPPFGSFYGELLILSALVGSGHVLVFTAFCVLMTMTFVATGRTVFPMIWGAPKSEYKWPRQTFVSALPKSFFFGALVVLGLYIPQILNRLLEDVAIFVGGA